MGPSHRIAIRTALDARDYRARRLTIGGYIIGRFTASEAMAQSRQCWRDVFAILKTPSSIERFA
jgi:hypothetical protein